MIVKKRKLNSLPVVKDEKNTLVLLEDLVESLSSTLWFSRIDARLSHLVLRERSSVRIEAQKNLLVLERVLLLHTSPLGAGVSLGFLQHGLNFGRVDETGDIGVGDQVGRQEVILLQRGWGGGGSVDLIQSGERRGSPDDETSEVSTRSELQKVEREDGAGLDTRDVAESLEELLAIDIWVVDDQRSTALASAAVSQFTLSGTDLARLLDFDEIWASTNSLQESNGGLGLGERVTLESLGLNDQRNLGDVGDAVAAGKEERRNRGSSQGGSSSKSPENEISG